jgi:hypothetical protein
MSYVTALAFDLPACTYQRPTGSPIFLFFVVAPAPQLAVAATRCLLQAASRGLQAAGALCFWSMALALALALGGPALSL